MADDSTLSMGEDVANTDAQAALDQFVAEQARSASAPEDGLLLEPDAALPESPEIAPAAAGAGKPFARAYSPNSLLDANAASFAASVAPPVIRASALTIFRERMLPQNARIEPEELKHPSAATRDKVLTIARQSVLELKRRHAESGASPITAQMETMLVRYLRDMEFGAGPIQPLLEADDVEDIIVNTVQRGDALVVDVWTYRAGSKRHEDIDITPDEVRELVNRQAASQGRAINAANPILNAQMLDGSRMNAVLDPVCDPNIAVTIRRHRTVARNFSDLVARGTLTVQAANAIWLMVQCGVSIVVAGGTGSGKTNMLNAVASVMPANLRCVVIEDTRELFLVVPDVVYLRTVIGEARANISQRQLVANALRMRPDRIFIGEVRDAAAWDAAKASNTGHDGTMLTVHAESAHSVVTRLLQLCSEAEEVRNMSEARLIETIAQAFNVVIFIERDALSGGGVARRIKTITAMKGQISDGRPQMVDLFAWNGQTLARTAARPTAVMLARFTRLGLSEEQVLAVMESDQPLWDAVPAPVAQPVQGVAPKGINIFGHYRPLRPSGPAAHGQTGAPASVGKQGAGQHQAAGGSQVSGQIQMSAPNGQQTPKTGHSMAREGVDGSGGQNADGAPRGPDLQSQAASEDPLAAAARLKRQTLLGQLRERLNGGNA